MDAKTRVEFAAFASQLRPLLNRMVFYGIETCRGFLDSREQVRGPNLPLRSLRAITGSQLARLAPELTATGFYRVGRLARGEHWETAAGLTLFLESSAEAEGDDAETGILEYATLITVSLSLDSGDVIRVSALPAQIALLWRLHRNSGETFSASASAEDLIELVVRRTTIREDVATLPTELRAAIAWSAGEFARSEAALWSIERALVDARAAPGCASMAMRRFHELAAL